MRRYAAASHLWRALPVGLADWAWQRRGRLLLSRAARDVPAYANLLRIFADPASADLIPLPTSRRSYVQVYPLEQRARRGWQRQVVSFDPPAAPAAAVADCPPPNSPAPRTQHSALSPQHSGLSTAVSDCPLSPVPCPLPWPRARDELQILRQHLIGLLAEWFDITRRRSLLVLALPESGWSSRLRISQALQSAVAASRLPVTVADLADTRAGACAAVPAAPRAAPQTALQTILRHAVGCEQMILLTDPAGAATHAAALGHLPIRSGLVVFGPCPDGLLAALPSRVPICSVLGADEVGPLIASETPLSRLLLTLCRSNPALSECLLPDASPLAFYQPLPRGPWLEQVGDDLLATSWGAAPVIRYRLDWSARLIPYSLLCDMLSCEKVLPSRHLKRLTRIESPCWKLPLIAISKG